jgi:histidinol dehydrogenase
MQIINYTNLKDIAQQLQRPTSQTQDAIVVQVQTILQNIQQKGQEALLQYTQQFDSATITNLVLDKAGINQAANNITNELKLSIQKAYNNIVAYHKAQVYTSEPITTMQGISCWRKAVGIEAVGLYIPGGTAPLFSTLLMLAIPATIAGCKNIILCTPPNKNNTIHEAIAYTAQLCSIENIYLCGGAQAIGAMAYGTTIVPKVYKIFGPGNQYVTVAKQLVQTTGVAIDMPAGPSEVLVIADEEANADFVAADLLSQAEHGVDSQVVCLTNSATKAAAIQNTVAQQLQHLNRKEIAATALQNSQIVITQNLNEAIAISNEYAPEHLILQTANAHELANQITNAGSVFIGAYTPESVGDYASGTNHVLPTNGFAKAYSGVSVESFTKKISFQQLTPTGLQNIGPAVINMATAEGLDAHANAVAIRLQQLNKINNNA